MCLGWKIRREPLNPLKNKKSRSEKLHRDSMFMAQSLNQRNLLFLTPFHRMNASLSPGEGSVMLLIKSVNPVICLCS